MFEVTNKDFGDIIGRLNLLDMEIGNNLFTLNNKMIRNQCIDSRLDCFLVSESITESSSEIHSSFLLAAGSNHWKVELWCSGIGSKFKKPFRFEQFWLGHLFHR